MSLCKTFSQTLYVKFLDNPESTATVHEIIKLVAWCWQIRVSNFFIGIYKRHFLISNIWAIKVGWEISLLKHLLCHYLRTNNTFSVIEIHVLIFVERVSSHSSTGFISCVVIGVKNEQFALIKSFVDNKKVFYNFVDMKLLTFLSRMDKKIFSNRTDIIRCKTDDHNKTLLESQYSRL